tara:strand:+ start:412 stop:555 length:144 start_codon:yes stop_codon:yes gene_type:complete
MDTAAVSAVTASVDFGTIVVGIGAVFAAVVLVKMALVGGRMLLGAIR